MKKFYSKLMALMLVFTFAFSTYAVNAADETGTAGTVTESGDKKDTPDSSGDENGGFQNAARRQHRRIFGGRVRG